MAVCASWLLLSQLVVFHTPHGTGKPMWLDEHLLLVDKLVFQLEEELEYSTSISTSTFLLVVPSLVLLDY